VLSQSYQNLEYVLVNNCSTDRSLEVAEKYARMDSRIRIINNDVFLPVQAQNYNHALRQISPMSKYCKIVQADDWIFPECITEMVRAAEANPTVGVVASYWLRDTIVYGHGLPYPSTFMSGLDVCKWHLLNHPDCYLFGTATSLLIRSDLIRNRDPFYDESSVLEDIEVCYELLGKSDFAFVHQVLTFTRVDNESLTGQIRDFIPYLLHALICLKKYGQLYLTEEEYSLRLEAISRRYFWALADGFLYGRGKEFWAYHKGGLQSIGYKRSWLRTTRYLLSGLMDLFCHPKTTALILVRNLTGRR
jgi:glycosyltransferase involved in cell wall biosynthesis